MHIPFKICLLLFFIISALAYKNAVTAQKNYDCRNPTPYVTPITNYIIYARHIFCGEYTAKGSTKDPKGLHSKALSDTWQIVNVNNVVVYPNSVYDGIYKANVTFNNGQWKNSSFFPDTCEYNDVINSVVYVAKQNAEHMDSTKRPFKGPSAPKAKAEGYCLTTKATPFDVVLWADKYRSLVTVFTAYPLKAAHLIMQEGFAMTLPD